MKKSIMMLMAISLAFALAAPAMAETAVEFSGRYFVRGTMLDNGYFSDDDGPAGTGQTLEDHRDDWYDQELRLNVTFKPNENVSVFWRFDIGDYNWGTQNYYGACRRPAPLSAGPPVGLHQDPLRNSGCRPHGRWTVGPGLR
jgi:hypothetical protein